MAAPGSCAVNFARGEPVVHHVGGHDEDGHGVGMVDIDNDGKLDILTTHGCFKNVDAIHDSNGSGTAIGI